MADDEGFRRLTSPWVLNAAVLVTNAAILSAAGPSTGLLAVMAVVTGLLALGSAVLGHRHRAAEGHR